MLRGNHLAQKFGFGLGELVAHAPRSPR
jgi:hypothetical protein